MTTLHARKLTLLKRIFYKYPKELILFVYFKVLKNRKHLRYLLFDKLYNDVGYVIRNHDKDAIPAKEMQDHIELFKEGKNDYYKKRDGICEAFIGNKVNERFVWLVAAEIKRLAPRVVVDIGCGNGYCLDILAGTFPAVQFYGLDFEVSQIAIANKFKNVQYISGYPLETFEQVKIAYGSVDMVISTQALLHALPKELERYFKAFKDAGVKAVCINDTNVNGYKQRNNGKLWSKHMGYVTGWCHNYSGYMKKYGYKVTGFYQKTAKFHPSRSDYEIVSIFGESQ